MLAQGPVTAEIFNLYSHTSCAWMLRLLQYSGLINSPQYFLCHLFLRAVLETPWQWGETVPSRQWGEGALLYTLRLHKDTGSVAT